MPKEAVARIKVGSLLSDRRAGSVPRNFSLEWVTIYSLTLINLLGLRKRRLTSGTEILWNAIERKPRKKEL
jgi:hypothetical protein